MPGSDPLRSADSRTPSALCAPLGRTPPAERRDGHLRGARVLLLARGLLEPSSLCPVQGLLLLSPDPQLGAAGPALWRGAHRPRPQLHVLPGELACSLCAAVCHGTAGGLKCVLFFALAGAAVFVLLPQKSSLGLWTPGYGQ